MDDLMKGRKTVYGKYYGIIFKRLSAHSCALFKHYLTFINITWKYV